MGVHYHITMNDNLISWHTALPGIIFSTVGYTFYHFIKEEINNSASSSHKDNTRNILLQRLTGIFLFGFAPALMMMLLIHKTDISFIFGKPGSDTWLWLLPLGSFTLVINYFISGSDNNLDMYPQIRKREWSTGLLILSALSWLAYLFAYELLFRAFLFLPLLGKMGLWPAVIINTGIYSLVHIPKGKREAFGSIPLGIILCLLVYKTGSFWIAFFIHGIMALSNEWFSLHRHPEIKLVR